MTQSEKQIPLYYVLTEHMDQIIVDVEQAFHNIEKYNENKLEFRLIEYKFKTVLKNKKNVYIRERINEYPAILPYNKLNISVIENTDDTINYMIALNNIETNTMHLCIFKFQPTKSKRFHYDWCSMSCENNACSNKTGRTVDFCPRCRKNTDNYDIFLDQYTYELFPIIAKIDVFKDTNYKVQIINNIFHISDNSCHSKMPYLYSQCEHFINQLKIESKEFRETKEHMEELEKQLEAAKEKHIYAQKKYEQVRNMSINYIKNTCIKNSWNLSSNYSYLQFIIDNLNIMKKKSLL